MRRLLALFGIVALATACGQAPQASTTNSLTGSDYHGKKYYFGWGKNGNGNSEMDNEVKYDVIHTNAIFTEDVGGDYIGKTLIGSQQVNGNAIKNAWQQVTDSMTTDDMYLQYSSGHGYQGGLEAGVNYSDIVNATLAMPARETIVFTMACYSGGLVNAFNRVKDRWNNYGEQGRTLFVMASSQAYEESSTGPGRDQDEPNGPNGSAGSAFGHSLWKALIGYADGAVDDNKDGYITLGEVVKYVVRDTQAEGGHTPVYTGVYDSALQLSKVPTREEASALLGDTAEGRTRLQGLIADGIVN